MNSIEFMNQLIQTVNSMNGTVFTLRNDIDTLKKELSNVKDSISGLDKQSSVDEYNQNNEKHVQIILTNMDKTKSLVEEMQKKLSSVDELYKKVSVDGELDYYKTVSKETSEKLKNLEIAFTLKMNTIERNIKNIPKSLTKEEIQNMIQQSIAQLLDAPRQSESATSTLETFDQEQILTIPMESIKVNDFNENVKESEISDSNEIEAQTPVDVVIQSIEPVSETKPKRKKTTKKTK